MVKNHKLFTLDPVLTPHEAIVLTVAASLQTSRGLLVGFKGLTKVRVCWRIMTDTCDDDLWVLGGHSPSRVNSRLGVKEAVFYSFIHPPPPFLDCAVEEINTCRPTHELKGEFISKLSKLVHFFIGQTNFCFIYMFLTMVLNFWYLFFVGFYIYI
jgi:hypothetical protein